MRTHPLDTPIDSDQPTVKVGVRFAHSSAFDGVCLITGVLPPPKPRHQFDNGGRFGGAGFGGIGLGSDGRGDGFRSAIDPVIRKG